MVRGKENQPWSGQADVVYRNSNTTAWINGRRWENNPGAVLVVPNAHVENIYALDRELAGDIHETVQRIAFAMKAAFGCDGVSTRQHNEPGAMQEVWHYHLHVFPRWRGDDLYRSNARLSAAGEREPYASALREAIELRDLSPHFRTDSSA